MTFGRFFVDLHIHIGQDWNGRPVKITGSKSLTVTNIVKEASRRKGLDMVGTIDAQAPAVQAELNYLIDQGSAVELVDGGIKYEETVLILGSEIEVYDNSCKGPIHVLCYFPFLDQMERFTHWLSSKMKNVHLSTQRFYGTGRELQQYVQSHGGLFIPAHVFTPFKSMYGKGVVQSLTEVFDPNLIDAVELGLSADCNMANQIKELEPYTYLTNSDAHSLLNLAREYQKVKMKDKTFKELKKALQERDGRSVIANYGLNPKMGKYHQTVCANCLHPLDESDEKCPSCGGLKIVKGVAERVQELTNKEEQHRSRPAYIYQIPLPALPGVGKKTYERLLESFSSEMDIIHHVSYSDLTKVVSGKVADFILSMRRGTLKFSAGGGGKYGKVLTDSN
ncbi:endonuclease Q family protein [Halobacillus sp. BBL2006]|uniref:endonuclease Q family protein n=1 Tax=Halobacillus sp. BBL2006 TaxID=1543706 RepID=UPI0005444DE5|nr:endonuclease Q family protein [Halobacillus sp. BBL2006]KHE73207.1 hypothetical protein LD39_00475 [Halobacillus sp. BBL2006]